LARGLRRARRFAATLGLFVCLLAGCERNAQTGASVSPPQAVALAAASVGATYRAIDASAVDAYLAGALLDPTQPIGAAQRCLKTDNSVGRRPTPLANPALAESSIEQRGRLIETLAAYDIALASFSAGEPRIDSQIATAELQRAVFQLNVAANAHGPGDLFIEDLASKLTPVAAQLAGARSANDARAVALGAAPTILKLLTILSADVTQWRAKALAESRFDFSRWLIVYQTIHRTSESNATQSASTPIPIPRCYEPPFPSGDTSPLVADPSADGATFPGRDSILARLRAASERDKALQAADPAPVVSSLSALNATLVRALKAPDSTGVTDTQNALLHFSDAAQALSAAALPLERISF
jgi:hypothetical protein